MMVNAPAAILGHEANRREMLQKSSKPRALETQELPNRPQITCSGLLLCERKIYFHLLKLLLVNNLIPTDIGQGCSVTFMDPGHVCLPGLLPP